MNVVPFSGNKEPDSLAQAVIELQATVVSEIRKSGISGFADGDIARRISETAEKHLGDRFHKLNRLDQRRLVQAVMTAVRNAGNAAASKPPPAPEQQQPDPEPIKPQDETDPDLDTDEADELAKLNAAPLSKEEEPEEPASQWSQDAVDLEAARDKVMPVLMDRIDTGRASRIPRPQFERQLRLALRDILPELQIRLNAYETEALTNLLIDDMLGLGPLETLLADEAVTDIMVNGAQQIFVERGGKLRLSDVTFRDNQHVMNVALRIVAPIGRRIDESSPLVDARLEDGSRVNIIIPPLAIDGPSISIRKFSRHRITLDTMADQGNMSLSMSQVLKIAARSRLNILISGGTGSGKTTLLNALSQLIDPGERIVTIEDAAELQLQQPHVVRLETRPPNLEGEGEITMRDLLKNSLRMRPDRIILGEVRGAEAIDMLQAMNTGHEGSLCTLHANRPREALTRLENMVGMAGINLPAKAVRTQICDAIDMIIQVSRMRDGKRRITSITEVLGMEGDVITTQELFNYKFVSENPDGSLNGSFISSSIQPGFLQKAAYFGLDRALKAAM